jgi:ABC-type dipeptide/oligopeptide/nickel transport system permease subunit
MSTVDITREGPADLALARTAGQLPEASARELLWRRLRRDRAATCALAFLAALIAAAALYPLLHAVGLVVSPSHRSRDTLDSFGQPTGPSLSHPFGVDPLGRDLVARVLSGALVSLGITLVSAALAVVVGTAAGLLAGYRGGWVDTLLSRFMDVMLAFPILLLGIGLASACSLGDGCAGGLIQPGAGVVIFVIALATWPYIARIVRGQTRALRERGFVEAARSVGASHTRIVVRELLPNLTAPVLVYGTLILPTIMLLEASLSFLGIGVTPPTASWGQMIFDASKNFDTQWWYMLFPGLALLLTVIAFNLLGEGLRDALDPKSRR